MRDIGATQKANGILQRNELPKVGQRVDLAFPDGSIFTGTMEDASETDGDGFSVVLDDGRTMDVPVSPDVVVTPLETVVEQDVAPILPDMPPVQNGPVQEGPVQEVPEPVQEDATPAPAPELMGVQAAQVPVVEDVIHYDPFAEEGQPAPQEPQETQAPQELPIQWEQHYDRAVRYARETDSRLTPLDMGKALDIDGMSARRVLAALASRGVIKKTRKGYRRPPRRKGSVDILTFLADRGGIRDDEGHDLKKGRGGQRFIPQAGPLIRKYGLSMDYAREAAAEAGYAVGNDTAEFLEVLDRAWAGNKVYTPEGGAEVAEQDAV
ncbi:MAG: hypothetical protein GY832_05100, partial [Chloroflexi bacterium]|nr:hypothetical protein [Chloroflexota bacterium]